MPRHRTRMGTVLVRIRASSYSFRKTSGYRWRRESRFVNISADCLGSIGVDSVGDLLETIWVSLLSSHCAFHWCSSRLEGALGVQTGSHHNQISQAAFTDGFGNLVRTYRISSNQSQGSASLCGLFPKSIVHRNRNHLARQFSKESLLNTLMAVSEAFGVRL
jgi:hypothetical protein